MSAKLRIEVDANETPRLYRGSEYLGVASVRELELWCQRNDLSRIVAEYMLFVGNTGYTCRDNRERARELYEQAQATLAQGEKGKG